MQSLQSRAGDLKVEQLRLRQIINEKNTASILVGLFAKSPINVQSSAEDPEVENLLKRPVDEIPDASKVSELPALILPGQHASRNAKALQESTADETEDGIDYELLGKDRSQCSPEELDRIRRERNRMHAKRTRDRKRLFTEQMSEICRQLEDENDALLDYLTKIDPDHNFVSSIPRMEQSSPTLAAQQEPFETVDPCSLSDGEVPSNQLSKLLQAATAFEKPATSTAKRGRPAVKASSQSAPAKIPIPDILRSIASSLVALSDESSASDDSHDEEEHVNMLSGPGKRQRTSSKYYSVSSPAATAVGC
ncbi:hypothetical protein FisN_14Lh348 [Fistulifera solaris]|uniref:BZIP domain-containing protein n=1 Tax=Fistulifera solaris TaxID=1519565 RepID=A0A1Z5JIQ7_FISSO|nr:hypothetical protein FisN_14Lh348 [Fistulifera solaris]|eukprot:GAX13641.1 hypothetical protein FisN_14Lh348 [Fistulifera solaris]